MKTGNWASKGVAPVVPALAVLIGLLAFSGISSAQEDPNASPEARPLLGKNVGIAIGTLDDGRGRRTSSTCTASSWGRWGAGTSASSRRTTGTTTAPCASLTATDGVITAKGAGGFTQPDGTRMAVVFEATFNTNDETASVTVKGKDGFSYTMSGAVDGLVYCGNLRDAPPTW